MPDLRRVLIDYDLGLLRVLADQWGIELTAPSQREAVEELAARLLQAEALAEGVNELSAEARAALTALAAGRQPLAQFTRAHGALRPMGAARREREQPWLNTPSPAEQLWYRGLLATAFFDDGHGPEEFAFIPDDVQPLLPVTPPAAAPPGEPFPAPSSVSRLPCGTAIADLTTLLAYLQVHSVRLDDEHVPAPHRASLTSFLREPAALDWLTHFAGALGLAAGSPFKPVAASAGPFLEAGDAEQTRHLAEAWRAAREWNDLRQLPGLVFEGTGWRNDSLVARAALLSWLARVPVGEWWSLASFVAAIKEHQPDFQRRGGDYDSWYIRDARTHEYLRGFAHWERVDGALIRWLIEGPLSWLGLVETFVAEDKGLKPLVCAFRLTALGAAFLGRSEWPAPAPSALCLAAADGLLRVPLAASRYTRFQIARIADWLPLEEDHYAYRLTPASLERAHERGITVKRILPFLREAAGDVPLALAGALQRWERVGREAALDDVLVLKLKSAELLETLRATPGVRELLGDALGPAVVTIRRADTDSLRAALAEVGILLD
jgi:hypothetical protein